MLKKSILALLQGKCPQCHQSSLFSFPLSRLSKFSVMNDSCPSCKVRFEPEPGFYQGAMFVGYALTVALITTLSAAMYLLGNPSVIVYMSVVIASSILVAPLNYRYSRIIYLYLFGGIKYDPRLSQ